MLKIFSNRESIEVLQGLYRSIAKYVQYIRANYFMVKFIIKILLLQIQVLKFPQIQKFPEILLKIPGIFGFPHPGRG